MTVMEEKLKRLRRPSKEQLRAKWLNCDRSLQIAQDEPLWRKANEGTVLQCVNLFKD